MDTATELEAVELEPALDTRRRIIVKTHPNSQGYFYIVDRRTSIVDIILFVRSELNVTTPPERLKVFVHGLTIPDTSFLFHGDEVVVAESLNNIQNDNPNEQNSINSNLSNNFGGLRVGSNQFEPPGIEESDPVLTLDDGTVITLKRRSEIGAGASANQSSKEDKPSRDYKNGRCETTVDKINRFIKILVALKLRPDILRTQIPSFFDGQKLLDEWRLDANFIVDFPTVKEALKEAVRRRQQRSSQLGGGRGSRAKRPQPANSVEPDESFTHIHSAFTPSSTRARTRARRAITGSLECQPSKLSKQEPPMEITSRTSGLRFDYRTDNYMPRSMPGNTILQTSPSYLQPINQSIVPSPASHHTTDHTHDLQPLRPLPPRADIETPRTEILNSSIDDEEGHIDVVDENQLDDYHCMSNNGSLAALGNGGGLKTSDSMMYTGNIIPLREGNCHADMTGRPMTSQSGSSKSPIILSEEDSRGISHECTTSNTYKYLSTTDRVTLEQVRAANQINTIGYNQSESRDKLSRGSQRTEGYSGSQLRTPQSQFSCQDPPLKKLRLSELLETHPNRMNPGPSDISGDMGHGEYSSLPNHPSLPALLPIISSESHTDKLPALSTIPSTRAHDYSLTVGTLPGVGNATYPPVRSNLQGLQRHIKGQQSRNYGDVSPSAPYSPPPPTISSTISANDSNTGGTTTCSEENSPNSLPQLVMTTSHVHSVHSLLPALISSMESLENSTKQQENPPQDDDNLPDLPGQLPLTSEPESEIQIIPEISTMNKINEIHENTVGTLGGNSLDHVRRGDMIDHAIERETDGMIPLDEMGPEGGVGGEEVVPGNYDQNGSMVTNHM